jgi:RNA polymerase sigma factor (sigma-70 family)
MVGKIAEMERTKLKASEAASVEHDFDWSAILREHERWLRTIVYARLGEPQAVDDVMQDVALAAVRQASPILDPTRVAPWLYRLAVRQTLLYRRKMGRTRNLTQRFADRYQPTESDNRDPGPLEWLLSMELSSMVRQAILALRSGDAEILMLKYAQNWNYHEIAEHLGIGHSAVEARLHRARSRMRKELEKLQVIEVGQ